MCVGPNTGTVLPVKPILNDFWFSVVATISITSPDKRPISTPPKPPTAELWLIIYFFFAWLTLQCKLLHWQATTNDISRQPDDSNAAPEITCHQGTIRRFRRWWRCYLYCAIQCSTPFFSPAMCQH